MHSLTASVMFVFRGPLEQFLATGIPENMRSAMVGVILCLESMVFSDAT